MRTIASHADFERVFVTGRRINHPLMRLVAAPAQRGDGAGRVAFVAAKRLGCAPYRNRSKRVMRQAARSCGLPARDLDLILFATARTGGAPYLELERALSALCGRAGIHG